MATVELGQTVKDVITAYEGVAVSITTYLHACRRIVVQSRELKDGKPVEDQVFDEQRLLVLDVPNILEAAPLTNEPGGERLVPRHAAPPAAY